MLSENTIILYSDDIVNIIRIMLFEKVQDIQFNSSLMMKPLLIADNFDSYFFICFVVFAF
jgi:hypothetical protein